MTLDELRRWSSLDDHPDVRVALEATADVRRHEAELADRIAAVETREAGGSIRLRDRFALADLRDGVNTARREATERLRAARDAALDEIAPTLQAEYDKRLAVLEETLRALLPPVAALQEVEHIVGALHAPSGCSYGPGRAPVPAANLADPIRAQVEDWLATAIPFRRRE
jgi:hypothetical protein